MRMNAAERSRKQTHKRGEDPPRDCTSVLTIRRVLRGKDSWEEMELRLRFRSQKREPSTSPRADSWENPLFNPRKARFKPVRPGPIDTCGEFSEIRNRDAFAGEDNSGAIIVPGEKDEDQERFVHHSQIPRAEECLVAEVRKVNSHPTRVIVPGSLEDLHRLPPRLAVALVRTVDGIGQGTALNEQAGTVAQRSSDGGHQPSTHAVEQAHLYSALSIWARWSLSL